MGEFVGAGGMLIITLPRLYEVCRTVKLDGRRVIAVCECLTGAHAYRRSHAHTHTYTHAHTHTHTRARAHTHKHMHNLT